MQKPSEKSNTKRIVAFGLLAVALFFFTVTRSFDYQIVHGDEYLAAAHKSSFTTVKVTAARGEIVDKNNVPFTQNKATFDVEFDYSFLKSSTENKIIYNLIKTFENRSETWIDNLPISLNTPYEFLPDRASDVARLKKLIGVNDYATAQNCMDALYELNDSLYAKDPNLKDISGVEYRDYSENYKRKIAGVRYSMLAGDFSAYNPRYTFASDISPSTVALIDELSEDFVGAMIAQKAARTYVGGTVASHLIGRLGKMNEEQLKYYTSLKDNDYAMNDLVGQGGVEEAFESLLRGKNGELRIIRDSKGDVEEIIESVTPEAGKTIKLTIDYNFNKEVDRILSDFITNFNATNKDDKTIEAASVIVLDAKTGALLSHSSYPYYDQNTYYQNYSAVSKAEGNPLFNRALNGLYRPGSTFKPIVAAAGFADGKIDASTEIFCSGAYHYPSALPTDWAPTCLSDGHRNQNLNVEEALKWSCNVFFYETGMMVGIDRINDYAHYFGLGAETGLEIPNKIGVISSPSLSESMGVDWTWGNVVQTAIGQMDTQITTLQLAIEAMTLANQGKRYGAHLLGGVYNYDCTEQLEKEKVTVMSDCKMSDEAYTNIRAGMIDVAGRLSGADNLTDLGFPVAIKTGTPQITVDKTNNAFIAYAPADNPEIAIACIAEDGLRTNTMIRKIIEAYERSK